MRQKIKLKNLTAPFWKFYKEKSIQIIENGGWHFNSLSSAEEISKKLIASFGNGKALNAAKYQKNI